MKTSNKILLSLFVTPFIIMACIFTALYGKYKNGEFVTLEQIEDETSRSLNVAPFSAINLSGLKQGYVTIKHADNYAVRVDMIHKDQLQVQSGNGVLTLVSGNSHDYLPVTVYCPGFEHLSLDSANATIDNITLANATINIGIEGQVAFNGSADSLTVNIKRNGTFTMEDAANIKRINLHLANGARFNNEQGIVQEIGSLEMNDSAILNVSGKMMQMIQGKRQP